MGGLSYHHHCITKCSLSSRLSPGVSHTLSLILPAPLTVWIQHLQVRDADVELRNLRVCTGSRSQEVAKPEQETGSGCIPWLSSWPHPTCLLFPSFLPFFLPLPLHGCPKDGPKTKKSVLGAFLSWFPASRHHHHPSRPPPAQLLTISLVS